jgi:peptidyl-prolyl cis-trans isomerase C
VKRYVCLLAILGVLAGCQKAPESPKAQAGTTPSAADAKKAPDAKPDTPKPVPAQLPDPVARVNGEAITRDELLQAVREFEERSGPVMPDTRDQVFRGVLDDMIAFRLLSAELKNRKLEVPPGELEAAMGELRGRFPTEKAYRTALAEQKMTVEQLRERTRTTLLINQLLEAEVGKNLSVKPAEIATFYEQNPGRFAQPEAMRLSHILIGVPQGASESIRHAARERAAEVAKRAKAGADFARLARTYSNDASRERGGDLGVVPRGQAQPAFEQAAFALSPGDVSDPVETVFGFHVIKAGEKRPAQTVPFGQAAPQVEQYLLEQRRQELARAYVNRLKSAGKVDILI